MAGAAQKKQTLPPEETALFCNQVATLLKSGIPLYDGMRVLSETYASSGNGAYFKRLYEMVLQKSTLGDAVKEIGIFPDYMVRMVSIGERVGLLEKLLNMLSRHYEREARINASVRSAILYPLLLTCMMAAVIFVLTVSVMPVFAQVYASLGAEASLSARALMRYGALAGRAALIVLSLLLAAALVLRLMMFTRWRGAIRAFLARAFRPVRRVNEMLSASRFANVMGQLLGTGFPIDEAVGLMGDILPDEAVAARAKQCAQDMRQGATFTEAVEKAKIFNELHVRMLRVSDVAGNTDEVLGELAETYDAAADGEIRHLVSIIEPAIVSALCVVIGVILLSVMLPLAGLLSSMI